MKAIAVKSKAIVIVGNGDNVTTLNFFLKNLYF